MIPDPYQLDFDSLKQDLQTRAFQRILLQFHRSPVLLQVLWAFVSEVQALSDAIVDVIKYRSLYYAQGVNQEILGRLVGQPKVGWELVELPILTVTGEPIVEQDGVTEVIIGVEQAVTNITDDEYQTLLLLKTFTNFAQFGSVNEVVSAISTATGVTVQLQRTGPAQITVTVPAGTDQSTIDFILRKFSNINCDNIFLFPYPAGAEITVQVEV